MIRKRFRAASVAALLLISFSPSLASDWSEYSNSHFTAYSDASKKRTRELLLDLERFRASVLQVANVTVPDSASRPRVLILKGRKQFKKLTPSKQTGGFAQFLQSGALIVLPASGRMDWAKTVIRHEYAHVLLGYKTFDYPPWYEEGFAEMAAATEIAKDGQAFIVGKVPERAQYNGRPIFPWDELLGDGFQPHKIDNLRMGSSAYAQAWILAHYTTLGDNLKNAPRLQQYFDILKAGQTSHAAFEQAFGVAPDRVWEARLRDYSKRIPNYTVGFRADLIDTEFHETPAATADVERLIKYLRARALAYWQGKPPREPLARVNGTWDQNSIDRYCDDPIRFTLTAERTQLTMDRLPGSDEDAESVALDLQETKRDDYMLFLPGATATDDTGDSLYFELRLRGEGVACWRRSNWSSSECGMVLNRCSD